MPIWLRRFTFNKIKEWFEKEQEQVKSPPSSTPKNAFGPDIKPSYTTKASK